MGIESQTTIHPPRQQQKEIEMNTTPKATSNADIMRTMHEIVDYHLYKSSWPANEAAVGAYWRALEELGLAEMVPGQEGSIRYTVLGIDSGAPLASYFIGAHEPMEIPMMLEKHGLIDEQEADAFYSSLEDESEAALHEVEAIVAAHIVPFAESKMNVFKRNRRSRN